jgi:hypothetical protein
MQLGVTVVVPAARRAFQRAAHFVPRGAHATGGAYGTGGSSPMAMKLDTASV